MILTKASTLNPTYKFFARIALLLAVVFLYAPFVIGVAVVEFLAIITTVLGITPGLYQYIQSELMRVVKGAIDEISFSCLQMWNPVMDDTGRGGLLWSDNQHIAVLTTVANRFLESKIPSEFIINDSGKQWVMLRLSHPQVTKNLSMRFRKSIVRCLAEQNLTAEWVIGSNPGEMWDFSDLLEYAQAYLPKDVPAEPPTPTSKEVTDALLQVMRFGPKVK